MFIKRVMESVFPLCAALVFIAPAKAMEINIEGGSTTLRNAPADDIEIVRGTVYCYTDGDKKNYQECKKLAEDHKDNENVRIVIIRGSSEENPLSE